MNENLAPSFEAGTARTVVFVLLRAWRSHWTSVDKGPTFIGGSVREYISQEQQLANQPEEQAYAALVDGAAAEVARSAHSHHHREVLDGLRSLLDEEIAISAYDKQRLISDVAARSIDLLASAN